MRTHITITLLISFFIVAGCASTESGTEGIKRSERAMSSMETVQTDVDNTLKSLGRVDSSLRTLVSSSEADMKKNFDVYSKDVSRLDEHGSRLMQNTDKMKSDCDAYFREWEKEDEEYENRRIQQLSIERRKEVNENYNTIIDASREVNDYLQRFLTDTKEIRSYLANDLTSAGIESIASLSDEVLGESDDLESALAQMQRSLDTTMSQMASRQR